MITPHPRAWASARAPAADGSSTFQVAWTLEKGLAPSISTSMAARMISDWFGPLTVKPTATSRSRSLSNSPRTARSWSTPLSSVAECT